MFLLVSANIGVCQQLYTEPFTGSGDVNVVGWNSMYSTGSGGGVTGGFAWVWHKGNCGNIIYTREYTVDISTYSNVEFRFDLRRNSYYSTTPEVSIAVEIGGSWYVSKTVFIETTTTFQNKTLAYSPSKDNWDTLNIATLSRGTTAASDLSGNITGFGLYSNSRNVGSDCTAEYDNFIITGTVTTYKSADFNGDGVVDFHDYAAMANAWLTGADELFAFFVDQKIRYMQFIPCVEKENGRIASYSITPEQYGRFLCRLFDLWLSHGPEKISIRFFDSVMSFIVHGQHTICSFRNRCNDYVVVEHNGDVFACDFFVQEEWRLGNILQTPIGELAASPAKRRFSELKTEVKNQCLVCRYFAICRGGCLKDRIIVNNDCRDKDYFCVGYQMFFDYALSKLMQKLLNIINPKA